MKVIKISITLLAALAASFGLVACGGGDGGESGVDAEATASAPAQSSSPELVSARLPQGSEPADLDPAEFTTKIDNPYLPFAVGSRWIYRETEDGEPDQKIVVEVTGRTKTVANGVEALVVRDTVTQGGEIVELTDDWFAQDSEGNVWYLGEDTAEYEDGKRVCRCGSFEAGVDGAEAGVIMPANPQVGMEYRQEFYEGEAEDEGKVLSVEEMAQAPTGSISKP